MYVRVEYCCLADARVKIAFAVRQAMVVEHNVLWLASCQRLIRVDWLILLEVLQTFVVLILYSYQFLSNTKHFGND